MKWKLDMKDESPWRKWLAWHPVQVGLQMVWLEWVERKLTVGAAMDGSYSEWEYRLPPNTKASCSGPEGAATNQEKL